MRRPIGRPLRRGHIFILVAVLAMFALPHASAASARARVEPALVGPGGNVTLLFSLTPPAVLDLQLGERVTCTVAPEGGAAKPACDWTGGAVEVRVLPGGEREFAFRYNASTVPGRYVVNFQESSTLAPIAGPSSAEAVFEVLASGPLEKIPLVQNGDADPNARYHGPSTSGDSARFYLSSLAGSSALVGAIVARVRRGSLP